jgi:hypothetical protein
MWRASPGLSTEMATLTVAGSLKAAPEVGLAGIDKYSISAVRDSPIL